MGAGPRRDAGHAREPRFWLGNEAEAREQAERARSITRAGSDQLGVSRYHQTLLALELGLENWEAAVEQAEAGLAAQGTMLSASNLLGFASTAVEAHTALGAVSRAEELTQQLEAAAVKDTTTELRRAALQSRGILRSATGDLDGAIESLQPSRKPHPVRSNTLARSTTSVERSVGRDG